MLTACEWFLLVVGLRTEESDPRSVGGIITGRPMVDNNNNPNPNGSVQESCWPGSRQTRISRVSAPPCPRDYQITGLGRTRVRFVFSNSARPGPCYVQCFKPGPVSLVIFMYFEPRVAPSARLQFFNPARARPMTVFHSRASSGKNAWLSYIGNYSITEAHMIY